MSSFLPIFVSFLVSAVVILATILLLVHAEGSWIFDPTRKYALVPGSTWTLKNFTGPVRITNSGIYQVEFEDLNTGTQYYCEPKLFARAIIKKASTQLLDELQ